MSTRKHGRLCLGVLGLALSGCSACSSNKNGNTPDLSVGSRLYFVAENGRDDAPGTRDEPFRTIARAMDAPEVGQIFVSAGQYPEPNLRVSKGVEIIGPGGGQAALEGHLEVLAANVSWSGIDVRAGLRATRASSFVMRDVSVEPGGLETTIFLEGTSGDVIDLRAVCGSAACLEVLNSTVALSKLALGPTEATPSKRVLRVVSSSVGITRLDARGGSSAQVQAEGRSDLTIRGANLGPGAGAQLVANVRARIHAFDVVIPEPGQVGVLAARGEIRLVRSRVGDSRDICAGTQGGMLVLDDSELGSCAFGSVTAVNYGDIAASVYIRRGVIRHGRYVGVNLSQGRVEVEGTRFEGVPDLAEEGDDAILASSPSAELVLRGVTVENAPGNGVGVFSGAKATINAVVVNPRLSGISIGEAVGGEVQIRGAEVRGCRGGSGLAVFDSSGVRIETTVVSGCSEAGLIAGENSEVTVDGGTFENNVQFGVAAFGQSTVSLTRTTSRGSPWAVFASCGDGSRVEDVSENRFEGQTTECF